MPGFGSIAASSPTFKGTAGRFRAPNTSTGASSHWKQFLEKAHGLNPNIHARLLTDITGRGYTIVLELSYEIFAELEPSQCSLTKTQGWKEFYQQFITLCEYSERTQYKLGDKLLNLLTFIP